jgi:hypothetical protein
MDRRPRIPPTAELRRWVETWRTAGDALARVKGDELARLDTAPALRQLADAFEHALRRAQPTYTSGLVEQQRIFARLRM